MDLPEFIECEIGSYCNRSCGWCPNSLNSRGHERNYISEDLWRSFLRDLQAHHYAGKLALHNYNEPLLDPYIFDRIKEARDISPLAKICIFTNGDPFSY